MPWWAMSEHPAAAPPLTKGDRPLSGRRALRVALPHATLEVRPHMPAAQRSLITLGSVLGGLIVSGLILVAAGVPAGDLLMEVSASLIQPESLHAVLAQAAPLILVGLAAAVAFRARFWNLGLEGQMIWGGIAATGLSLARAGPPGARILLMGLAAILGGLAWALVPLLLKRWCRVNEIIATLLLNYIAMNFLFHLLYGPWKDPTDAFPHSLQYVAAERLPVIGGGISAALPISLVLVLLVGWAMQKSRFGFYLTFIHANAAMALRMGLPVAAITAAAVLASGALAGLAGFVVSAGTEGRLTLGFYEGYGFSGVLIAFLARNNPAAAALAALFIAVLFVTGQTLQIFYQIPAAVVQLIQAIIVMCVAASEFFVRHRVILRR